jgi:Galactose oxidase, central domain
VLFISPSFRTPPAQVAARSIVLAEGAVNQEAATPVEERYLLQFLQMGQVLCAWVAIVQHLGRPQRRICPDPLHAIVPLTATRVGKAPPVAHDADAVNSVAQENGPRPTPARDERRLGSEGGPQSGALGLKLEGQPADEFAPEGPRVVPLPQLLELGNTGRRGQLDLDPHRVLLRAGLEAHYMNDLRRFDIAERKWLAVTDTPQRGDVPRARQWAYGATRRNTAGGDLELLMFFGVEWDPTPPYVAAFTDAHALRLSNDTWRQLSPGGSIPAPRVRFAGALDTPGSTVYVHGGYPPSMDVNSVKSDLHRYNITANAWFSISPSGTPPPGLGDHVAVASASRRELIIFGGTLSTSVSSNAVYKLDIVGESWIPFSLGGTTPSERAYPSMILRESTNELFVFFGYKWSVSFQSTFASLDLDSATWNSVSVSSVPWSAPRLFTPNGRCFRSRSRRHRKCAVLRRQCRWIRELRRT